MVVIMPFSMPMASCSTLATGARQLVVQEAFEMTMCSFLQAGMVHAVDDGVVGAVCRGRDDDALGAGGEVGRGLVLCREDAGAFECDVDAEVLPGKLGGSLIAVITLKVSLPIEIASPLTVTSCGNLPWTES